MYIFAPKFKAEFGVSLMVDDKEVINDDKVAKSPAHFMRFSGF